MYRYSILSLLLLLLPVVHSDQVGSAASMAAAALQWQHWVERSMIGCVVDRDDSSRVYFGRDMDPHTGTPGAIQVANLSASVVSNLATVVSTYASRLSSRVIPRTSRQLSAA